METLYEFVGKYLGLQFCHLTDELGESFDIRLTTSDLDDIFQYYPLDEIGVGIFHFYINELDRILSKEYDDYDGEKLDYEINGACSFVSYNNMDFTNRAGFEEILSKTTKQ